tara:strand:+ start:2460 stop:2720 length:261 start_codon:yes stop_codon:yes gene_type:complete
MPKILDRLSSQLINKGHSKKSAYAIATKKLQDSGNLHRGTNKATTKGILRGNMTPSLRAKQRASKLSGKPISRYKYSSSTNRATLK